MFKLQSVLVSVLIPLKQKTSHMDAIAFFLSQNFKYNFILFLKHRGLFIVYATMTCWRRQ